PHARTHRSDTDLADAMWRSCGGSGGKSSALAPVLTAVAGDQEHDIHRVTVNDRHRHHAGAAVEEAGPTEGWLFTGTSDAYLPSTPSQPAIRCLADLVAGRAVSRAAPTTAAIDERDRALLRAREGHPRDPSVTRAQKGPMVLGYGVPARNPAVDVVDELEGEPRAGMAARRCRLGGLPAV